ncbi:MAG: D-alanine--D-alanine ligase [Candidatus Ancaeobacter aquaticus]|nr:D-alanine--D-alanine ligase [Candidatus Ancaeobacter aquaticus]
MRHSKVGVLFGGSSSERDISLRSGDAIVCALKERGYDVTGIDVDTDHVEEQLLTAGIDVAFIALHGRYGEDGSIQTVLERLNIPYTGSGPEASSVAICKVKTKEVLVNNNIPTPRYEVITHGSGKSNIARLLTDFRFPLVVKPSLEGSSIGLSIIQESQCIDHALEKAFSYECDALIEEYIAGKEVTVGVLGESALPVIEIVPKNQFYDYHAKYTKGMTEYLLVDDARQGVWKIIKDIALMTHKAIGCEHFSRVDLIIGDDGIPYVLEINTIPGFTETSLLPKAARADKMSFEDLCEQILQMALTEKRDNASMANMGMRHKRN